MHDSTENTAKNPTLVVMVSTLISTLGVVVVVAEDDGIEVSPQARGHRRADTYTSPSCILPWMATTPARIERYDNS